MIFLTSDNPLMNFNFGSINQTVVFLVLIYLLQVQDVTTSTTATSISISISTSHQNPIFR